MDGRGRAADNIFVDPELRDLAAGPGRPQNVFNFYNGERGHQSLGYQPPDVVYTTGQGGGAKIIDKFSRPSDPVLIPQPGDGSARQGAEQQVFCWT